MAASYRATHFNQVCVWEATSGCFDEATKPDVIKFFKDNFNTRIQLLEEVVTKPDTDHQGGTVEGTGGRIDVLFAIHDDDVAGFSVPRFKIGVRWIEDVLNNEAERTPGYSVYPDHVVDYRNW